MKRALVVATVENFLTFEVSDIHLLQELGYEVHIATNRTEAAYSVSLEDVYIHDICFQREPFTIKNIKAYKELCTLVKEVPFDMIHCHTPVGGVMGRTVGHKYKIPTIYTVHGFHFYNGAPIRNWLLYYPVEKWLSWWTDILITINKEDFKRAKKFHAKKVAYIPGVGVDIEKIAGIQVKKEEKRKEIGIPDNAIVLLSVGELNKNKNHIAGIMAVAQLRNKKLHYVICGQGELKEKLLQKSKMLGIEEQIHLLGYRRDIYEIYKMADIYLHPSYREGLPVALMEAMASELPCIASNIRGNRDLIYGVFKGDKRYGLFCPSSIQALKDNIQVFCNDIKLQEKCKECNLEKIIQYDKKRRDKRMRNVYQEELF